MAATATAPDDPTMTPEQIKQANAKARPAGTREPLDPITRHLWRDKRPRRVELLLPFVGHRVKLDRWFGRVAANGDQTYHGEILAVATTTIGSAADLVILKTAAGQVWAISTAQVAYLELDEPKPVRRPRGGRTSSAPAAAEPAAKSTRRRKAAPVEVPDDAAA